MAISQDAGHWHAVGFAQAEADLMTFDDRFSARLKDWCVKQHGKSIIIPLSSDFLNWY
jgi:hypothetical protein